MKKPSTASLRYFALLLGTVGLLWSVSVSVADPRQWGPPGQPIRQGHHIEWQRAAYVDANGYTLMVWSDTRTGDRDVFAQLIEPDGDFAPGWPVHVVNFPYRQEDPEPIVATDGFIIAWIDFRFDSTGDVFAQKLNYAGTKLWAPEGVVVDTHNTSMVNETTLRGASDGAGGAIVAFEDTRRGDAGDIFAQRILSNGTRGWANVLAVTDQPGPQNGITADTDGQGGLIVGWNDSRNDGNIYAAKITNTGTLPWGGVGGRAVCDFDGQQTGIKLCPDLTTGGAFFAWADKRDTVQAAFDIYGQRFNAAGNAQWAADGVPIAVDTLEQSGVRITPSISGGVQDGVVLCWQDTRVNGSVGEVYAQKMNAAGVAQWAVNGIKIVGDAGPNGTGACRDNSRLTSDLSGGALYVWDDTRHDPCNILQYNTYMQHANAAGTLLCADGGFAVNTNVNQQQEAVLRTNGTNTYCIYSDFYRGSRTLRVAKIDVPGCSVIANGDQEVLFGLDGDATNPTNIHMYWGNVAFVWEDNRGVNFGKQIFYQVLDTTYAKTYPFIPDNGTPIAPVSTSGTRFEQSKPFVCTDAQDGFFCAFENLNDGVVQVRLQRVGSSGHILCDEAGDIVHATGIDQKEAQVVSDGMGGCYVLWSGFDPSFQLDVYAMRMDGNCQPMWAEPTLLSNNATADDHLQSAVADGNGCVVAVWETGEFGSYDILGARVCRDGSIAWQDTVSAAPREQTEADAAADGQGGVYVAWSDTRDETHLKDIYAQRFNSAGEAQWTNNGRLVVTFAEDQKIPRLAVDSQGQAYIAWQDFRNTDDLDIYGQKLALDGSRLWPETTGRPICQGSSDQSDQQLLVDWNDGLYMVWEDGRTNPFSDIYGVHYNSQSNIAEPWWDVVQGDTMVLGGVVNSEYQNQSQPALAHDYHGGTVAVWVDWRSSGKEPLQNIWGNWVNDLTVGVSEVPAPLPREYMLTQNFPNPFNPSTEFRFTIPNTEAVKVSVYNTLGQEVENLIDEVMTAGTYDVRFDASELASGTYFYRLETPNFQSVKKMVLIK